MLANKMNLRTEIERYEGLRKQCDEMIATLTQDMHRNADQTFVHAFRDVCVRQIDLLKRAVTVVK